MNSRLIIVDDHFVVRDGLRDMLRSRPDLQIVGEAASDSEALQLVRQQRSDLIILDISLSHGTGIDVLRQLRALKIDIPVLVFTMHPAEQYAQHVRTAGAQGFLNKNSSKSEILAAIDRLLAGGSYFPRKTRETSSSSAFALLSARESEVLRGLLAGTAQTQIALQLQIASKSVGTYRRRILDKLGVNSTAELVALATRLGMDGR